MMDFATLSSQFKAIGDASRLRILHLLSREELSVGELVRILDLPQSTVSRQLKPLKEEGLIADRPVGSATYYQAALEAELGNGTGVLRDALWRMLRDSELPPADQSRLDRVLALREAESGQAFFDRIGLRWDALREECFGPTFHLEAFLHLLPAEWTVADLGTGTGYLLPALGRHFARVIGVDMSQPMMELAKRRVEEAGLDNTELREGRLETLPLKDGEVDLAVCLVMLHHLEDVPAALREIGRALRPGGQLLIAELHLHENEAFRVAMADRRPGIDPEQMRECLADSGFAEPRIWDLPRPQWPEHELAPLPGLYAALTTKR
jgi:ArsR family transcriptional regulator